MEKFELDVRPQASVYQYFTRLNYLEWYALAEFVDNSTASYFAHEKELQGKLTVEINYDPVTDTITIEDDAYGMELDDFKRAILLESVPTIQGGRNEFGMGLKTAATWFGRKWTVESTEFNSKNLYIGCMDLDKIIENKTNSIDIYVNETEKELHYTKITIEKLNRKLSTKKIKNKIIEILQSMYRRDIESGKIEILYNGTTLVFEEYEPLYFRNKTWKKDLDFTFLYDEKQYRVTGFVGILNKGGYDKAGFALFRRNRVIIGGLGENFKPKEIFIQDQSQISLKLYGEINMDAFEINQAKDGFSWDSELQELFINNLKMSIMDYLPVAKMAVKDRQKEEEEAKKTQQQNEGNENNPSEKNDEENPKSTKKTNEEPKTDNSSKEKDSAEVKDEPKQVSNVKDLKHDTGSKVQYESQIYTFKYLGAVYTVKFENMEDKPSLYKYDSLENVLTINNNHNFINALSQTEIASASKMILAFVLAEYKAKNNCHIEGYMSVSMMHNQFNKILKEIEIL